MRIVRRQQIAALSLFVLWSIPVMGQIGAKKQKVDVPAAGPPVEFELRTEPGFPIGGAQKWLQLLARLEQNSIRVQQAEPGDEPAIENQGTAQKPVYRVTGILTSQNRLRLPRGEFGLSDRERIGDWIKQLATDGAEGPKKTTVYGLTEEQLVTFHDKLAAPIQCQTKARRAGEVARDIVNGIDLPFTVSEMAREAFGGSYILTDDLTALSAGTALAATLRPLGLVLRPETPEKSEPKAVRLLICGVRETEESWPVGWPPQDIPSKVAPKLFEYLKVTITSRPLSEAMAAIEKRVEVPFLVDHNSMARREIDPTKVKVSYSKDRAMYRVALDNLLFQAKLSSELRVDEAGRAFLWITPR